MNGFPYEQYEQPEYEVPEDIEYVEDYPTDLPIFGEDLYYEEEPFDDVNIQDSFQVVEEEEEEYPESWMPYLEPPDPFGAGQGNQQVIVGNPYPATANIRQHFCDLYPEICLAQGEALQKNATEKTNGTLDGDMGRGTGFKHVDLSGFGLALLLLFLILLGLNGDWSGNQGKKGDNDEGDTGKKKDSKPQKKTSKEKDDGEEDDKKAKRPKKSSKHPSEENEGEDRASSGKPKRQSSKDKKHKPDADEDDGKSKAEKEAEREKKRQKVKKAAEEAAKAEKDNKKRHKSTEDPQAEAEKEAERERKRQKAKKAAQKAKEAEQEAERPHRDRRSPKTNGVTEAEKEAAKKRKKQKAKNEAEEEAAQDADQERRRQKRKRDAEKAKKAKEDEANRHRPRKSPTAEAAEEAEKEKRKKKAKKEAEQAAKAKKEKDRQKRSKQEPGAEGETEAENEARREKRRQKAKEDAEKARKAKKEAEKKKRKNGETPEDEDPGETEAEKKKKRDRKKKAEEAAKKKREEERRERHGQNPDETVNPDKDTATGKKDPKKGKKGSQEDEKGSWFSPPLLLGLLFLLALLGFAGAGQGPQMPSWSPAWRGDWTRPKLFNKPRSVIGGGLLGEGGGILGKGGVLDRRPIIGVGPIFGASKARPTVMTSQKVIPVGKAKSSKWVVNQPPPRLVQSAAGPVSGGASGPGIGINNVNSQGHGNPINIGSNGGGAVGGGEKAQIHINNVNSQGNSNPINIDSGLRAPKPPIEVVVEETTPIGEIPPVIVEEKVWEPISFQFTGPANPDRLWNMLLAAFIVLLPLILDWVMDYPEKVYSTPEYLPPTIQLIIMLTLILLCLLIADWHFGWTATIAPYAEVSVTGAQSGLTPLIVATVETTESLIWGLEDVVFGDGRILLGMGLAALGVILLSQREPVTEVPATKYASPTVQALYFFGSLLVGILTWNA